MGFFLWSTIFYRRLKGTSSATIQSIVPNSVYQEQALQDIWKTNSFRPTMKSLFKTLFAPIIWLLQACNPLGQPVNEAISKNHFYNHPKSDIQYSTRGNWFELGHKTMNADVKSFEVFNNTIAKDKNRAYFESNAIIHPHLHLESFHGKPEVNMSNIG